MAKKYFFPKLEDIEAVYEAAFVEGEYTYAYRKNNAKKAVYERWPFMKQYFTMQSPLSKEDCPRDVADYARQVMRIMNRVSRYYKDEGGGSASPLDISSEKPPEGVQDTSKGSAFSFGKGAVADFVAQWLSENGSISGETVKFCRGLSGDDHLISRSIYALRKEGWEIESVRGDGYKLVSMPEDNSQEISEIRAELAELMKRLEGLGG